MKTKKTIGILGGMGPLASSNLYYDLIELAQNKFKAEQDHDFPPILIYSLPLEGFDETGFVNQNLVKKQLIKGVQKLEKAGSDFIIIGCNTVHYFYDEMQSSLRIPILSIISQTSKDVAHSKYKKIGLLSSDSTRSLGIYQKELKKFGIETVITSTQEQKIINGVILKVMSGHFGLVEKIKLKKIVRSLLKRGAEAIVIGCTELPLVINQNDFKKVKIFNSTKIITEFALAKALRIIK